MPDDERAIGGKVRTLRRTAGLSQAELAEAAGISERSVSDLERGLRVRVYPATARQLAAALGLQGAELAAFLVAASGDARPSPTRLEPLPSTLRSRLPMPSGTLIGRDAERAALMTLLRDRAARVVTVVGPAGVGKTRLAIAVADAVSDSFGGAIQFVNLSAIDSAGEVLPVIAAAVGAPQSGDAFRALTAHLSHTRVLLLLDTMEHVLGAARAVSEMVSACPALHVLSTSRSPLNVRGERLLQLNPLAVSTEDDRPSSAVQLFLDRAHAVAPELPVNREILGIADLICRRVDGLPLAIELAAARAHHLPLSELLASLDERVEPLTGGPRDEPPRHRTMRAAMDWSYNLLDESHRRQLRALSVFRGGFDVDAAAWVDGPGWSDHRMRVTGALSHLVDTSLVTLEHDPTGRGRYRLLDVVRDYARERAVETGETGALQRRHADFYVRLAEQAEPHLRGAEQREWHARLVADESNLRAAMTWTLEHGDADMALNLAGSSWMFWRWAGLFREGRRWLQAALAREGATASARLRALWGAGWLAYHQAEYGDTAAAGREILESAAPDDGVNRRNGLTLVGIAELADGHIDSAIAAATDALSLAETTDAPWLLATSLLNLGTALLAAGDVTAARPHYERALELYITLGDRHFSTRTLIQLAYCSLTDGHRQEAAAVLNDALDLTRELGDLWGITESLEAAAALAALTQPGHAALLAGGAHRIRERIAMNAHPADARINQRHLDEARAAVGAATYDAAWRRGADLTIEALQDRARGVVVSIARR
jgi:predicted ATPase/DNA-binding XRE family transcriptional regulator